MVFIALAGPGKVVLAWVCDCRQRTMGEVAPAGLIGNICRCREWSEASIVLNMALPVSAV
jgi:hypothetical protein